MIIREEININSDPESIFNYLIDLDNRKDYIPALEEVILLDPLPIKKGSRYIEVAKIGGRRLKTTYQITEFIRNELIAARTLESVFPIQVALLLVSEGKDTTLKIRLELTLKGIYQLASGIVQAIVSQQARGILRKVKRNIESETDLGF